MVIIYVVMENNDKGHLFLLKIESTRRSCFSGVNFHFKPFSLMVCLYLVNNG